MHNKHNLDESDLEGLKIPQHVAIIMDGNGRWAKKRGQIRTFGHNEGAKTIKKIAEAADEIGIKYLTCYAFSTENWSRPKAEVEFLMELLIRSFNKYKDDIMEKNTKVRVIGDRNSVPKRVLKTIDEIEKLTKDNDRLQLNIAFNYGGRREIAHAASKLAQAAVEGKLKPEDITEEVFAKALYLPNTPDPDLLIRSSGEKRVSNFLLWEIAYTEFWTSDILWPDFSKEALIQAIIDYNDRDRRFGGLKQDE